MKLSEIKTMDDIKIWLDEEDQKKRVSQNIMMFDDMAHSAFSKRW